MRDDGVAPAAPLEHGDQLVGRISALGAVDRFRKEVVKVGRKGAGRGASQTQVELVLCMDQQRLRGHSTSRVL